ncbi:MAG: tetratricopeptide repeat protein [Candidatus Marinimicrobia bacterium]|jgi:class 3 adenylate cyclase/tetratricopeptide (TPR) repeat protein|nr:tetratricopeptide repeat protein [Candidatus Neomarinimicrobiota bacterium]
MEDQKRKLAAIVFTDIVGFTKLTAKDQTLASALLTKQREAFKPIVESHGGTWLKEMGDGLLLIFDTVTEAVNCCIKIQEEALNIEEMILRIGIHQGEILMLENDVIGDDVNVASRIEAFSAPGGIAISGKVYDAIVREMHYKTKYIGRPKLKGVGQDVTVYCIISHGLPETNMADVSAKLEDTRSKFFYPGIAALVLLPLLLYLFLFRGARVDSIAVLYMDVGSYTELNYLETITEDLIFDLTSSSQGLIKVSEPVEVKKHKDSDMSLEDLADELGVDFVFKSSVQPDDNGFIFRVRLFDSGAGKDRFINKWYIEKNSLQSVVAVLIDNIVKELGIEQSEDYARLEYDPESYDLYLQAKNIYATSDNYDDNVKAVTMMEDAISKDDNLVMAQIYLGTMQYDMGNYTQASVIYEKALSKSKSLQDNASMAESLRKQGQLLRKRKDYGGSLSKFSEALSMSTVMSDKSSMAKTFNSMAILNWKMKEKDEALKNWLQALAIVEELDDKPKISKYLNNIGIWYQDDSDYSKSVEYYQKSLTIKEDLGDVRNIGKTLNNIGNVYFMMGDYVNSVEYYGKSVEIKEKLQDNKGLANTLKNIGETYFYLEEYQEALRSFRRSISYGGKDQDKINENEQYIGMSHYYLGHFDSCNVYLNRADEYYSSSQEKRLAILPYLIASYKKVGDAQVSNTLLKDLRSIAEDHEALKKDLIIANWASYEALDLLGHGKEAKGFLENAYFEIKSRSRDIKDKDDRSKYLATTLHTKITKAWNSK